MFGYVKPYQPTLTVREYEFYRATYCGLCHALSRTTGVRSTLALSYDTVFLVLVRLTVGEDHVCLSPCRCLAHPTCRRNRMEQNPATEYGARALALLTYHKLDDDVRDSRGFGRLKARISRAFFARARKKAALADLDARIAAHLGHLSEIEKRREPSIDVPAAVFGQLLGEVFAHGAPEEHRETLYRLGDMMGRFIYVADAAEDYQKDKKSGAYNPFVLTYPTWDAGAKADVRTALLCLLSEGEANWHALPFGETVIVRHLIENVLYEGLVHRLDFLLPEGASKPARRNAPLPYEGVLP